MELCLEFRRVLFRSILTLILSIVTCTEAIPDPRKFKGLLKFLSIILATASALLIVLGSPSKAESGRNVMLGNICFFFNIFAMACYLLLTKRFVFSGDGNALFASWKEAPI